MDEQCKRTSNLSVWNFFLLIIYTQSEIYKNQQTNTSIYDDIIIIKNPLCIRDANLLDVLFIFVSAKINLFFPNCMSE
jgi:hypothetical protein